MLLDRVDAYKEVVVGKDIIIRNLEKNVSDYDLINKINTATIAVQKQEIKKGKQKMFMIGGIGIAGIAGVIAIMK